MDDPGKMLAKVPGRAEATSFRHGVDRQVAHLEETLSEMDPLALSAIDAASFPSTRRIGGRTCADSWRIGPARSLTVKGSCRWSWTQATVSAKQVGAHPEPAAANR